MKLKNLKNGELFTKKPIENPHESQVWIRGDYDRTVKAYECQNWADANRFCTIKGEKEVFVDFVF